MFRGMMILVGLMLGLVIVLPAHAQSLCDERGSTLLFDRLRQMLPADSNETWEFVLGDVDGDGDPDIAMKCYGANDCLYLNDGRGRFIDVSETHLPPQSPSNHGLALVDVEGDGDPDLVIANDDGKNFLYLNDGKGHFSDATATHMPGIRGLWRALAVGDVDGDSDPDLVFGRWNIPTPDYLFLNDGTGHFTDVTATHLPQCTDVTWSLALGDVDGDSDPDLVIGKGGQDRLFLNDGTGHFTDVTATHLPKCTDATSALALGDVDGDAFPDLVIGNNDGQDRLYLNDGTGHFTDITSMHLPAILDNTIALGLFDTDEDGDSDLLKGRWLGIQNSLYLNDGTGHFTDATAPYMPTYFENTNAVCLGDVDGDGDSDLVFGNDDQQDRLHLNDGTGAFTDVTATHFPIYPYSPGGGLALEDVDNDKDPDLALGGNPARLYLNDGSGRFTDATWTHLPPDSDEPSDLVLEDVNGDGYPDLVVGIWQSGPDRLYLNDTTGHFSNATATHMPSAPQGYTCALAAGDVDGDGDCDLVLGRADMNYPQQDRLYLNDGTGHFSDVTATHLPAIMDNTVDLALGDVDDDGDLDLALGGAWGTSNRLYENDGQGQFTDVTATHLGNTGVGAALVLGDVDGDEDLDLSISSSHSDQLHLYLNDGTGHFTEVTSTHMPPSTDTTASLALGDVDGDGDPDLVLGNNLGSLQNRILTNLTQQLAWWTIPSIGKPLIMDLYGPENGWFNLASSRLTVNVAMPPYGVLRIAPGAIIYQGGGNLNSDGRASVSFNVPSFPILVGRSLYWQAVVGPPAKLTNLEITTFTNL